MFCLGNKTKQRKNSRDWTDSTDFIRQTMILDGEWINTSRMVRWLNDTLILIILMDPDFLSFFFYSLYYLLCAKLDLLNVKPFSRISLSPSLLFVLLSYHARYIFHCVSSILACRKPISLSVVRERHTPDLKVRNDFSRQLWMWWRELCVFRYKKRVNFDVKCGRICWNQLTCTHTHSLILALSLPFSLRGVRSHARF